MRALLNIVTILVLALAIGGAALSDSRGRSAAVEVTPAELPPEARRTLELIKSGGPYPYRQDGTTFGNRERRLPQHEHGYYREFTVPTPGAKDRGARRIVAGKGGEYYYTADHYGSFRRVRQ
jgi:ribonuclease T1